MRGVRTITSLTWLCIALSVLFQTSANVLSRLAGLYSSGKGAAALVINPWYAAMMAALILQAVTWTLVLRKAPLSLAYPFMSLMFPLNLLCAWLLLGESVHVAHIWGTALIVGGVVLVAAEVRA
jgi:multidrug transporter EmrE-like cation transporter